MTALDELEKSFEDWRDNRIHPSERVPQSLIERARSLSSQYREQEICARIRYPRRKIFQMPPLKQRPPRRLFLRERQEKFVEVPLAVGQAPVTVEIASGDRVIRVHLGVGTDLAALFSSLLKL